MSQINLVDIRQSFIGEPTLSARFGDRVFLGETTEAQAEDYVVYQREVLEGQRQVDEIDRIEFFVFSKDAILLEEHCQAIRDFYQGAKVINGTVYWKIVFLDMQPGSKLNTGYLYQSLRFIFQKVL